MIHLFLPGRWFFQQFFKACPGSFLGIAPTLKPRKSYTPVNYHSNEKWTLGRCISYWKWVYAIAMLVYQRVRTNNKNTTAWGVLPWIGWDSSAITIAKPPGYRRWLRWSYCHGDGLRCSWEKGQFLCHKLLHPPKLMNRHQKIWWALAKVVSGFKDFVSFWNPRWEDVPTENIFTLPETKENAFEHRLSLIQGRSWFHGGVSMFWNSRLLGILEGQTFPGRKFSREICLCRSWRINAMRFLK